MENPDLNSSMQDLMAEMAAMRAELNTLKERAQALPQQSQPAIPPTITTTRRKILKRLGLAFLGGVAVATAVGLPAVEAKVIANPQINGLANRAGMLVLLPGAAAPINTAVSNYTYGLIATGDSHTFDLYNLSTGNTGVYGYATGSASKGVFGLGDTGVYGIGSGTDKIGVFGQGDNSGVYGLGGTYGLQGRGNTGVYGTGTVGLQGIGAATSSYGVTGSSSGDSSTGVSGSTSGTNCTAVSGVATGSSSNGIFGQDTLYAGLFAGDVHLTGTLTGGTKSFKIDHPLDPANKYLYHTSIESPDMKNIYDGVVTLDNQGEATVTMPPWFEALNSDFRYQLTSMGAASPNLHLAEKLANFKFKIGGGLPGQEVSWQITGIRQDVYAKAHRSPVEEDKPEDDKGTYLHPELFGQPEEMGVHWRPLITKKD